VPQVALFYLGVLVFSQTRGRDASPRRPRSVSPPPATKPSGPKAPTNTKPKKFPKWLSAPASAAMPSGSTPNGPSPKRPPRRVTQPLSLVGARRVVPFFAVVVAGL
jgi:hypothetical protein